MYRDFYGLAGRPFQLTPDPAFNFESLSHRKALTYLTYGLAQGEGFVVITGEVGAGKSTLIAQLMATIDEARITTGQVVGGHFDGDEIILVIARAFGLAVDPAFGSPAAAAVGLAESGRYPAALAAIERFLHDEARDGRRCLLVVDEAQNLPIAALEKLRLLANWQLGAHPLLQILLLGRPEFRRRLQCHPELEQLRQRVIASHHLGPLEAEEAERYILHRLKCVGWNGNPSFDPGVFAEIHSASGGVPRRLNRIVNRLLLLGAVERKGHVDGAMLSQVLLQLVGDEGFQPLEHRAKKEPAAFGDSRCDDTGSGRADDSHRPPRAPGAVESPAIDHGMVVSLARPIAAVDQPVVRSCAPAPAAASAAGPPGGASGAGEKAPFTAQIQLEDALAWHNVQIGALQQAVLDLAECGGSDVHKMHHRVDLAGFGERLASLENRVLEQERSIRRTLTMLIDWIERDGSHCAAA